MVIMKFNFYILFGLLVFFERSALIQNDLIDTPYVAADTLNENSELCDSKELITISLRFDITQYKKKRSDKDYLDALREFLYLKE